MKKGAIIAACALGACASMAVVASWWISPAHRVEQRVRQHLFDPDSAQFSGVTWNAKKEAGCGTVNAKNRMGGYTGATHFVIFNDGQMSFQPHRLSAEAAPEDKLVQIRKEMDYIDLVKNMCEAGGSD